MHKVLIAHSSEDVRLTLENIISSKYETLTCADCCQAFTLIQDEKPDVLILDLSLHGGPATELLTNISKFLPRVIMATTWFPDDSALQDLPSLGVDFVMALPGKLGKLIYRLEDLLQQNDLHNGEPIETILNQLHIPKHLDGYKQMITAITMYRKDPMQTLSKEIYPQIAREMQLGSWKSVDRSIRTAIKAGWLMGDRDIWARYFPNAMDRPNAKLFISEIADRISRITEK